VSSFPKVSKATLLTPFVLSRQAILNSGVFKEGWWGFNHHDSTDEAFAASMGCQEAKKLSASGSFAP